MSWSSIQVVGAAFGVLVLFAVLRWLSNTESGRTAILFAGFIVMASALVVGRSHGSFELRQLAQGALILCCAFWVPFVAVWAVTRLRASSPSERVRQGIRVALTFASAATALLLLSGFTIRSGTAAGPAWACSFAGSWPGMIIVHVLYPLAVGLLASIWFMLRQSWIDRLRVIQWGLWAALIGVASGTWIARGQTVSGTRASHYAESLTITAVQIALPLILSKYPTGSRTGPVVGVLLISVGGFLSFQWGCRMVLSAC